MAGVEWVKITTGMFDNRKIKHLRRLPDGNNIVLIWVMLLTMAGRCNAGGMIFLTENIPYTPKMLADELDFEENTVILALQALEQFQMIVTDGDRFRIAGWEEYQNIEGLDRIREQNRLRKQRQRERQKLLACDSHGTVTQSHATEEDKEEDLDIKNKNNNMGDPADAPDRKRDSLRDELQQLRPLRQKSDARYLTRQETARRLRISLVTLSDWVNRGKISAHKIGGRVLFRESDVEAALNQIIPIKR